MEHRIIFATANAGKMREIRMILGDFGTPVLSMKEAGIMADITEDGKSFEENAVIKAEAIRDLAADGDLVLADDSGLEIDYLDGAPGIYSARFMGEDTSYALKNAALVKKLDGVPEEKRTARFVCAIACALPDGHTITTRGVMEGKIAHEIRGEKGFGYDPIFYLPEFSCTAAEIAPEQKNEVSHRGKALRAMRKELQKILIKTEKEPEAER